MVNDDEYRGNSYTIAFTTTGTVDSLGASTILGLLFGQQ
jgi:hypothetical protein